MRVLPDSTARTSSSSAAAPRTCRVARAPRRPSGRRRHHARAARDGAGDAARVRARVPADRGGRGRDRPARRLRRPRRLRVRRVDLGRSLPLDPGGGAAAAAGRRARLPAQLDARDPLLARRRRAGRRAARPAAVRPAPRRLAGTASSSTSPTATGSASSATTASRSSTSSSSRRPNRPRRTSTTTSSPPTGRRKWPAEEIWRARKP